MGASPLVCLSCHFLGVSDFCDMTYPSSLPFYKQTSLTFEEKLHLHYGFFFIIAFTAHIIDCISQ